MANSDQMRQLEQISSDLHYIDKDKLLRPTIGELSLNKDFGPMLEEILNKAILAYKHASTLHEEQVGPIVDQLALILEELETQANADDRDYVARRENFLEIVGLCIENIKQFWTPFAVAELLDRDPPEQAELEKRLNAIMQEADEILQQAKERSAEIIAEAENVEQKARSTALGTSLGDAQKQFSIAQKDLNEKVLLWGGIGGVLFLACIVVGMYFWKLGPPEGEWRQIAYHSIIRVSILAVLGTATAFCLRIFRAHLHMREKNKHRQHVANCIGAFSEAASTPEQRDLILGQLVESIVQFGSSGLLSKEDEGNTYRLKIDPIIKSLGLSKDQEK